MSLFPSFSRAGGVVSTRGFLEEQAEMPETGMGHANFEEWFPLSVPKIPAGKEPGGMGGHRGRTRSVSRRHTEREQLGLVCQLHYDDPTAGRSVSNGSMAASL
jgi:hypothetical protein